MMVEGRKLVHLKYNKLTFETIASSLIVGGEKQAFTRPFSLHSAYCRPPAIN